MSEWLPGAVAIAAFTCFALIVWWPAVFLVWGLAALRYEWADSKEQP